MNRQLFNAMVAQYGKETVSNNGSDTIEWSGGVHCALPSLKFYGLSEQYGTPTPDSPAWIYGFQGPCMVHNGPYFNTPPLHGIGEYKDEWDYVTGKGVRRVKEIVLDGVSDYRKIRWLSSEGRCDIDPEFTPAETGGKGILSTHFKPLQGATRGLSYIRINTSTQAYEICLSMGNGTFANVTEVNAWLAEQYANGTPVTVYYALAEPIPFEERPDYAQYQAIPNESGKADIIDSGMNTPFEVSYVVHSTPELCAEVEDIPSLTSSDNYVLQDKNGIYLNVKE